MWRAYVKLASLQQSAKQFDDAIRSFEKARQYAPQEMQLMLLVAGAYTHAATGNYDAAKAEALQVYQQVLQRDGRFAPAVHFWYGQSISSR
jgi:cytochrome c-type biogenesis protein CcmH/NrfG